LFCRVIGLPRVDVFVYDRQTGVTTRASVGVAKIQANSGAFNPAISGDGRYVAFDSVASKLMREDANEANGVFVRDTRPCFGDANETRAVNFSDFSIVLSNFGAQYPRATGVGDATLDAVVAFSDITSVLANCGAACN
jgi:Tol biopolymer transport system component